MSEQKTPRTDAVIAQAKDSSNDSLEVVGKIASGLDKLCRDLERSNAELLEALKALIGNEANADIQRAKAELFRLAPDIQSAAFSAIAKAKGEA